MLQLKITILLIIDMNLSKLFFRIPSTRMVYITNRGLKNEISATDVTPVSAADIKTFLDANDIAHKKGYACITATCPRFSKSKLKMKEADKLFINNTTGFFVCQSCKQSGSWDALKDNVSALLNSTKKTSSLQCFGESADETKSPAAKTIFELLERCHDLASLTTEQYQMLSAALGIERLKRETLREFGILALPDKTGLILPSYDADMTARSAKLIDCCETKVTTKTIPRLNYVGLVGWNIARDAKHIALVASEFDAVAVYQETGISALALPRGTMTLPQEILPFLEPFERITIWFDNNLQDFEVAKQFAKKLNAKRCYLVRPEKDSPAPLKALTSNHKLSAILSRSSAIQNNNIVSFNDHREDVKNELLHNATVTGVKWKTYPKLNEILKGHRRGELSVFTGPTGSGKTTFMSDYSLDLCLQGVNTLWGSFEITNIRLMKMMLQQFAKKNLSKNMEQFDQYADEFELLPMFFMNFHGEENIKRVIETMSHAVYVHDITHVIVDNLQFMMGTVDPKYDRFHRQDMIVGAFRKFASTMNCHVTLVIHPRKEEGEELTTASIFGSAKASQEADNILILQNQRTSTSHGRKYLQITKNRFDGQLGSMALRFDRETLSFAYKYVKEDVDNSKEDLHSILEKVATERPIW